MEVPAAWRSRWMLRKWDAGAVRRRWAAGLTFQLMDPKHTSWVPPECCDAWLSGRVKCWVEMVGAGEGYVCVRGVKVG